MPRAHASSVARAAPAPSAALAAPRLVALALPALLFAAAPPAAGAQRVWSMGIPNFPFTTTETELYNHTLAADSAVGVVNHFWSCACGGRSIDWATEGGIAVYRLYVDGESEASLTWTPREAVGLGTFDPEAGGSSGLSLREPWATDVMGKLSDYDAFFFKIKIPFYKSIRLTAQLPAGVAGFNVYTIIRGTEAPAEASAPLLSLPGIGTMPFGTKMVQARVSATIESLGFIPVVNITGASGFVYSHAIAVQGHPSFHYLEGCFHLISPVPDNAVFDGRTGVAPGFPGAVLSTGSMYPLAEDYYSSSFYFHGGLFAAHDTGVTHMCGVSETVAPRCAAPNANVSQWAAFRVHDTDPLPFTGGVQLLMRNGDKGDPTPCKYLDWMRRTHAAPTQDPSTPCADLPRPSLSHTDGAGKCYNLDIVPDGDSPGPSLVSSVAWVYVFPQ